MTLTGFSPSNLERKYSRTFGYYLHLHGSPLFIQEESRITKISRDALTLERNESSSHIVLTHISKKPAIIAESILLTTYWNYLQNALAESEEIIFIGYSGLDLHLNESVYPHLKFSKKKLRIVEWSGAGDEISRQTYWKQKMRVDFDLIRLDNITEFNDW